MNIKNKEVYWIHRMIALIYSLGLIFLGFGILSKFDLDALLVFLVLLVLFGWMMYLHFVASNESAQGSTRGRNISKFIAVILLFLFPIGTVIALYLFYKTTENEWQKQ
ncbi:hypothetical protein [Acinetobacter wuhouensis]|uniref:Uncharacterized protein n=1 Tax=Acinetobacter wuhouensis TaxID=1879050 RepID=A0A3G2T3J2_9GAMM|nr:hypothetical protein [Acinetobacter wuhouensis]AYO54651.1 hypothetical protein CDG68_13790 [Acinetobacter wuhouensis]RZG48613.1 hypothetical protein EXU28_02255 [Acinetobacter wuhouensis]RZG71234.1 hypothetical protein EXU29_14780 [Acinetobacter wuhouensis]